MDNSVEMKRMLETAMKAHLEFDNFDVTKNVQDQLQEMARPNWKELPYLLTTTFNGAVNGGSCSYVWDNGKHFTSMEQLWLAFVMKEKHGKTWDGDKWVTGD